MRRQTNAVRTLVVGCDGSGKTTLLEGIRSVWGDTVGESTQTPEAREFRRSTHRRVVDAESINQRETLYLDLSRKALESMLLIEGSDVITSDSSLVTLTSHATMRMVIGEPHLSNQEIIELWQESERVVGADAPDLFVLLRAKSSTIRDRIVQRQEAGDTLEEFWGFNAPFFLDAYQKRWQGVFQELAQASYRVITYDTGSISVDMCLEHYGQQRKALLLERTL